MNLPDGVAIERSVFNHEVSAMNTRTFFLGSILALAVAAPSLATTDYRISGVQLLRDAINSEAPTAAETDAALTLLIFRIPLRHSFLAILIGILLRHSSLEAKPSHREATLRCGTRKPTLPIIIVNRQQRCQAGYGPVCRGVDKRSGR